MRLRILVLAATLSAMSTTHAAVFQVGAGANCYSPNPQDALDAAKLSAGPDTVALTQTAQLTGVALTIDGHDVSIVGGYNDCLLGVQGASSLLDGAGGAAAPVLTIIGPADVVLESLDVRGGDAAASERGGGVLFLGAGRLQVQGSRISDNVAGRGGGIAIVGNGIDATELILDANTHITDNRAIGTGSAAGKGGGLYVERARLTANATALVISDNYARQHGGGIYLENAQATLASDAAGTDALLTRNHSDVIGGALLAYLSRVALFTRDPLRPTRIAANTAHWRAAGISLQGGSLTGWDVVLEGNESTSSAAVSALEYYGVALDIAGDARFVRDLTAAGGAPPGAVNCAPDVICNRFEANRGQNTSGAPTGAALAFLQGNASASLLLEGATVRGNSGFNLTADKCYSGRGVCPFSLTVSASMVSENVVSNFLFDGYEGTNLSLDLVTLTRNTLSTLAYAGGSVDIRRCVIWQPDRPLWYSRDLLPGRGVTASTSLLHEDPRRFPMAIDSIEADPRFVAPTRGDLRLSDESPALDFAQSDASAPDAALAPRNIDLAEVMNVYGPLDLGAYERPLFEKVFRNGFEAVAH